MVALRLPWSDTHCKGTPLVAMAGHGRPRGNTVGCELRLDKTTTATAAQF
jgi:hypothetical protein